MQERKTMPSEIIPLFLQRFSKQPFIWGRVRIVFYGPGWGGTWVAHSVKWPSLDLSSGLNLRVVSSRLTKKTQKQQQKNPCVLRTQTSFKNLLCSPRTKTKINTHGLLGFFYRRSGAAGLESLLVYLVLVRSLGPSLGH